MKITRHAYERYEERFEERLNKRELEASLKTGLGVEKEGFIERTFMHKGRMLRAILDETGKYVLTLYELTTSNNPRIYQCLYAILMRGRKKDE